MQNNKNDMKPITIISRHSAPLKRLLLSLALLVCCADAAWGDTYYVFRNYTDQTYLYNNGNLGTDAGFRKASIWIANGDLEAATGSTRTIRSYTNESQFLNASKNDESDVTLGSSVDAWHKFSGYDNTLGTTSWLRGTNYYLRYNGTKFYTQHNSNSRTNTYVVTSITISENAATKEPDAPTISADTVTSSGIHLSHTEFSGSYTPKYYYTTANSTTYYWTDDTNPTDVLSTSKPATVSSFNPTYTWSIESGTADIDPVDGLVTNYKAGTITVKLTTSDISPLDKKESTYSFTVEDITPATVTTIETPTISPTSATINYNGSVSFKASSTAYTDTYKTYQKITVGGKTYCSYNGTIYGDETTCKNATKTTTSETITYTWTLGGTDASCLLIDDNDGATTKVSANNTENVPKSATLTVTATANGQSKTAQASITINAKPKDNPTSISITSVNPITIYVGNTSQITYSLQPANCLDDVTYTSANTSIATVSSSGLVTGKAIGQTTTTVTALNLNGEAACSAIITVNVRNKVAKPVISYEPTIAQDGTTATATITCSTSKAVIYYTVNGSAPTTSSSVYSSSFTVNDGDIIRAYAVMPSSQSGYTYWDDSDVNTLQYSKRKMATPVIDIDKNLVTITSSDTDADKVIYYTLDGSEPTTSSTRYTGSFCPVDTGLTICTIKAISVKPGCQNSDVASADFTIASGTSGTICYLNDLEDHNWTYYKGVDSSLDDGNYNTNYKGKMYSPNPRNVKITYYGNGVMFTADDGGTTTTASGVQVSYSETETQNTFIYFKTLERDDNGRYPYEIIPNPFAKRPVYDSDATTKYRGFYKWRIKTLEDGAIYTASSGGTSLTTGSYLDAETTYYFQPSDYNNGNVNNATSMKIELEAVWARAEVSTSGSFSKGYNSVERNFYVMTSSSSSSISALSTPCTYTSLYPNGTTDGTTLATKVSVYRTGSFTPSADSKIEYILLNNSNSSYVTVGSHNLTFGRGISYSSGSRCAYMIRGVSGQASGLKYRLRVESGVFQYISYTHGTEAVDHSSTTISGTIDINVVLGCDYDRAIGDNDNFLCQNEMAYGYGTTTSASAGQQVFKCIMKSGKINSSVSSVGTADLNAAFYVGIGNVYNAGYRIFEMEGGIMKSLAAGICNNTQSTNSIYFRIKGGTLKGSIYGSAANANSHGYKRIIVTGGTINGWIAGGGNGTSSNGGTTDGTSYVYIGGNSRVDSNGNETAINSSKGGNVFGSGSGVPNTTNWGEMSHGSNVVLADNGYVERDVYGGGNYGWTLENANIYILGNSSADNVFGGANQNKGVNANIYMGGGNVRSGLYGGSNTSGTMSGNVKMVLNGGQIGTSATPANAHGGGYGSSTVVSGNVDITIGKSGATSGITAYGDIYGGSALGKTNGTSKSTSLHTNVTMNAGTIYGSLYGGGLEANVYAPIAVTVNGGSIKQAAVAGSTSVENSGAVYGCNNESGTPQSTVSVTINGTDPKTDAQPYALYAVYGGGNQADYSGTPVVTINNCNNSIEYVYGGGKQADVYGTDVTIYGANTIGWAFAGADSANVTTDTKMDIYGGTIEHVFGGNNHGGTIGDSIKLYIDGVTNPDCTMNLGEVYGGGNEASSNVGNVTLKCPGYIQELYGGARNANITGDISMNIAGGKYGTIYGGNNLGGSISGNITIGVTTGSCDTKIGTIYGGGNKAAFDNTAAITINTTSTADSIGTVFGGGNLADVNATSVTVTKGVIENIYGGGNLAAVGSTSVTVNDGSISGNVFGGGKGTSGDNSTVMVKSDGTNVNIYGGTLTNVFGGNDAGGTISGTLNVTVDRAFDSTPLKIKGDVYGGGNEADSKSGNIDISCVDSIGTVYGGARNANVTGNIVLNIESGAIENVFGGNNLGGVVNGKIEVNVQHSGCTPIHIGSLYGAGNLADYSMPSGNSYGPVINLLPCGQTTSDWTESNHCLKVDNIFGAGKGQEGSEKGKVTGNPQINVTAGEVGNIYGGGNLAAVDGSTFVNISQTSSTEKTYVTGNVYGGGNLASTSGAATVNVSGGTVSGDTYGGGAYANTGTSSTAASQKWTTVSLTGGTVNNVYGGALGDATHAPTVGGPIMVTLNGSIVNGDIFGCNNISGTPLDSVTVHIIRTVARPGAGTVNTTTGEGDYHVASVYGGGNKAAYVPTQNLAACKSKVLIDNCGNVINYVYGGGNAASVPATAVTVHGGTLGWVFGGGNGAGTDNPGANVGKTTAGVKYGAGTAQTLIEGGTIYHLFGGSNTTGDVVTGATLTINPPETGGCTLKLGEVYGAGNEAEMYGYSHLILGCVKDIDVIYGGAKNANLHNDVEFTVTGGKFSQIFGGNNLGGTVKGSITVNIEEEGCEPTVIGEVYACGNQAPYTVPTGKNGPTVNINSCTSIGTVYGGGLGSGATVTGDTYINIELTNGRYANNIGGKVGTIGNVYGGGNEAALIGDTHVKVATQSGKSARITGNVYGGGNKATVTGHTNVQIGQTCN